MFSIFRYLISSAITVVKAALQVALVPFMDGGLAADQEALPQSDVCAVLLTSSHMIEA